MHGHRISRRGLLAAVITISALSVATENTDASSVREAGDISALRGVWRSRGYGWLWVIKGGRLRVYEESGSYCIPSGEQIGNHPGGVRVSDDGRLFRIVFDDPTYEYVFDRIEALPTACMRKPSASPPAVVDAMEKIFTAHYAFFRERSIDWPTIVRAARKKVTNDTSEGELLEILRQMISNFDDDHVSLQARVDGERVVANTGEGKVLKGLAEQARKEGMNFDDLLAHWKATVWTKESIKALLGDSALSAGNGNISYGLIDKDVGFLLISAMEDFAGSDSHHGDAAALEQALDGALALFKGAKAVIVDVSINDGGYDTLARQIAARFAHKRTLAYYRYPGSAPRSRPQPVYMEPSERLRYTGPVYVLTSNVTVSSGETFTMAMRALPHVTHVGQRTRGAFSELSRRLPNGWSVMVSNEVFLDAEDKAWEGVGIPPTMPMRVFPEDDGTASPLEAVRALVARIRSGKFPKS